MSVPDSRTHLGLCIVTTFCLSREDKTRIVIDDEPNLAQANWGLVYNKAEQRLCLYESLIQYPDWLEIDSGSEVTTITKSCHRNVLRSTS